MIGFNEPVGVDWRAASVHGSGVIQFLARSIGEGPCCSLCLLLSVLFDDLSPAISSRNVNAVAFTRTVQSDSPESSPGPAAVSMLRVLMQLYSLHSSTLWLCDSCDADVDG